MPAWRPSRAGTSALMQTKGAPGPVWDVRLARGHARARGADDSAEGAGLDDSEDILTAPQARGPDSSAGRGDPDAGQMTPTVPNGDLWPYGVSRYWLAGTGPSHCQPHLAIPSLKPFDAPGKEFKTELLISVKVSGKDGFLGHPISLSVQLAIQRNEPRIFRRITAAHPLSENPDSKRFLSAYAAWAINQ